MIQTVTGAIDKKDLGITLPHEHILINHLATKGLCLANPFNTPFGLKALCLYAHALVG